MRGRLQGGRVGLVIGQLSYGGAESQLFELASRLPERYRPVVYCLSSSTKPYGERLRNAGVRLSVIETGRHFDFERVGRLAGAMRRDRIDIAHAFLFIASAYTYLATRWGRRPALISSARNCKREPNQVRRWVMTRAFRASDVVVCNSHEMARFAVAAYRAPRERIRVVYNGVDTRRFAFRGHRTSEVRIGTIGRLEGQKNLPMFLQAAAAVARTLPVARFDIVGSGSARESLEGLVQRLGLEGQVRFVGSVADVPAFLEGLDQFWLTSAWEGTPNVVLEAMAVGVPVLATRVGGVAELIDHQRTGIAVDAGDVDGFVGHSLDLLKDPSKAAAMAQRARAEVERRFSIEVMVETMCRVYDELLERRA